MGEKPLPKTLRQILKEQSDRSIYADPPWPRARQRLTARDRALAALAEIEKGEGK